MSLSVSFLISLSISQVPMREENLFGSFKSGLPWSSQLWVGKTWVECWSPNRLWDCIAEREEMKQAGGHSKWPLGPLTPTSPEITHWVKKSRSYNCPKWLWALEPKTLFLKNGNLDIRQAADHWRASYKGHVVLMWQSEPETTEIWGGGEAKVKINPTLLTT